MAREIELQGFEAHPDGSGAPCFVILAGAHYQLDYLGELKCNCTRSPNDFGIRAIAIRAHSLKQIKAAYMKRVDALGDEWKAKNSAMYANASF